jgi:hypothetical protein
LFRVGGVLLSDLEQGDAVLNALEPVRVLVRPP